MWLKASARRSISEEARFSRIRAVRSSPLEMELAAARICSMGRKVSQAMSQPPPSATSSRTGSSVSVITVMVCIRPELSPVETRPRIQSPVTSMST